MNEIIFKKGDVEVELNVNEEINVLEFLEKFEGERGDFGVFIEGVEDKEEGELKKVLCICFRDEDGFISSFAVNQYCNWWRCFERTLSEHDEVEVLLEWNDFCLRTDEAAWCCECPDCWERHRKEEDDWFNEWYESR